MHDVQCARAATGTGVDGMLRRATGLPQRHRGGCARAGVSIRAHVAGPRWLHAGESKLAVPQCGSAVNISPTGLLSNCYAATPLCVIALSASVASDGFVVLGDR